MTTEEKRRTALIATILKTVVSISASQQISQASKKKGALFPLFEKDALRRISLIEKMNGSVIDFGGGSGFIVHASGIVVTNTHVIYHEHLDYTVTTNEGVVYPAKLLGTDEIHDVAFLKIESHEKFPCVKLGDSRRVVLGQTVYAIGNALGYFKNTISSGIVSGLTRSIEAMNEVRKEELHGLIQTDAAINPGNSGGPLIDSDGKVIGINSAAVSQAENIAFAIPINVIKDNLSDVVAYGKIRRAFFGVRHVFINERIQKAFNLPASEGIWVISPSPNESPVLTHSPAEKAGIREKDIICEIDGKKISEHYTLEEFLEEAKGGQSVGVSIIRGSKKMHLKAILEERS